MKTIRLWIVLLFVVGAVHLMSGLAEAVHAQYGLRMVSRACPIIGINESVTWDPVGLVDSSTGRANHWLRTRSAHWANPSGTQYVFQHAMMTDWEYWWRQAAQHTGEFWGQSFVKGVHRTKVWDEQLQRLRIQVVGRTRAKNCNLLDW